MTISGRGTVATGRVERGELKLNDPVEIVGIKDTQNTVVTGIEMFRKSMDFCEAGDNVGLLLRGIKREDIERGQVLCKPGSVTPHTKFTGEIYVLTKEEGGRHTRSSMVIVLSSTSVPPTLPVRSSSPRAPRWLCLVTTSPSRATSSIPSPWRRACVSYPRGWPHIRFGHVSTIIE